MAQEGEFSLPELKRQRMSSPEADEKCFREHKLDPCSNGQMNQNFLMICEDSNRADNSSDSNSISGMNDTELPVIEDYTPSAGSSSYRGPSDISHSVHTGPCQPTNVLFPPRAFGKDSRSFKQEWYLRHPWLEYSVMMDGAYCYVCRVFAPPGEQAKDAFTNNGFRNWKRAMERKSGLRQHERGEFHQRAFSHWMTYCQMSNQNTYMGLQQPNPQLAITMNGHNNNNNNEPKRVYDQQSIIMQRYGNAAQSTHRVLSNNFTPRTSEPKICKGDINRRLSKSVIDALMFSIREGPKFKSGESNNSLLEATLDFLSKHDESLSTLFRRGIDPFVYDEARRLTSTAVRSEICKSIKEFSRFSIMFVDCQDKNKNNLIAFCFRYFSNGKARYSFFGYQPLSVLNNEEGLVQYVNLVLGEHGISLKNCIGQTYDEAPVLLSRLPRMQEVMTQFAPQALLYCSRQFSIELLLARAARSTPKMAEFFSTLSDLCAFFTTNVSKELSSGLKTPHDDIVKLLTSTSVEPDSFPLSLCKKLRSGMSSVFHILVSLSKELSVELFARFNQARTLLLQMDIDFLYGLVIVCHLSDELILASHREEDLTKGFYSLLDLINLIKSILERFNGNDVIMELWQEAVDLRDECLARFLEAKDVKESILPTCLKETAAVTLPSRATVVRYFVDMLTNELNQYFGEEFRSLIQAVDTFNPRCTNFLNIDFLDGVAEWYGSNESDLENEMKQLKRFCDRQREKGEYSETIEELVENMTPFQTAFYESFKLMHVIVTLTSRKSEPDTGTFLKRLRSFFSNNASTEELSDLSLLCLEPTNVTKINLDSVVKSFTEKTANRFFKIPG